ncbi:MAG: hypothetical protein P8Y95_03155 [Gammaproteobacteria bacterium]
METLFDLLFFLHIVAGCIGLFTFPVPLTATEGSELQQRAKDFFFWAAIAIAASAALMVSLRIGELLTQSAI